MGVKKVSELRLGMGGSHEGGADECGAVAGLRCVEEVLGGAHRTGRYPALGGQAV